MVTTSRTDIPATKVSARVIDRPKDTGGPIVVRGGAPGSGSGAFDRSAAEIIKQQAAAKAAAEVVRKNQASKDIERQRQLDIGKANKRFRDTLKENLRSIQNVNEKQQLKTKLTNQLQQEIANAQVKASLKKLEAGIITGTSVGLTKTIRDKTQAETLRKAIDIGTSEAKRFTKQLEKKIPSTDVETPVSQTQVKPKSSRFSKIVDFAFGEKGRKFLKIPIFTTGPGTIGGPTIQQVKTVPGQKLKEKGFTKTGIAVGGISGLVPETPGGLAVLTASAAIFPSLPKLARIGISGGIAAVEIPKAFDPSRTPEERVTSGIVGGLAGTGTLVETVSLVRGGIAQTAGRLKGTFKPVRVQPEGFRAIEGVEGISRIGLIEKGSGAGSKVRLPKSSALRSGADVLTSKTKSSFLGGPQTVTTSQIGLIKEGQLFIPKQPKPIVFFTPQDPTLKIPQTRVTRTGIQNIILPPPKTKIGFGLPKFGQIILKENVIVSKSGVSGFKLGAGPELEVTSSLPIKGIKVGETTLKGQVIDIFKAVGDDIKLGGEVVKIPKGTTTGVTTISGESTIGVGSFASGFSKKTPTKTTTPQLESSTIPLISSSLISFPSSTVSLPISIPISPPPSPPVSPPPFFPSPPISPPPSPPPIFPSPPISPPSSPSSSFSRPPIITPSPPILPLRDRISKLKTLKARRIIKAFEVFVRRGGKFKKISKEPLPKGLALRLGTKRTISTLAATFKLVPKGTTRKKDIPFKISDKVFRRPKNSAEKLTFIERKPLRLKKGSTEISEILGIRKSKSKKKRKRRK